MTRYRADHVGSLIRPPALLEARDAFAADQIDQQALRRAEETAILEAIQLQHEAGLDVVNDGEYRRQVYVSVFNEAVEGWERGPALAEWRGEPGVPIVRGAAGSQVVTRRLVLKRRMTGEEAPFLKAHAGGPCKVTLLNAAHFLATAFAPGVTDEVYASREELGADLAELHRQEAAALIEDGVDYIQFDAPRYMFFVDEAQRARLRELGTDPDQAFDHSIEVDNASFQGLDRSRATVAVHLCRGNSQGRWYAEGSYESIAERLFNDLAADRFLLEYDSGRAGGFEPLRHVPADKTVVLGFVSTKTPELEEDDDVVRRIEEAARFVDLDRLALSPQCGFASQAKGTRLTWDDQRRKLDLVGRVADRVWG